MGGGMCMVVCVGVPQVGCTHAPYTCPTSTLQKQPPANVANGSLLFAGGQVANFAGEEPMLMNALDDRVLLLCVLTECL